MGKAHRLTSRCLLMLTASLGQVISSAQALEPIAESISRIEGMIEIEEAAITGGRVVPVWLNPGQPGSFLYTHNGTGDVEVYLAEPEGAGLRQLTQEAEVRKALKEARLENHTDTFTPTGLSADHTSLYLRINGQSWVYDLKSGVLSADSAQDAINFDSRPRLISDQYPTTFGDLMEAASPDGRRFVGVENHNLYLRTPGQQDTTPLTRDGHSRLTWLNTQESAQSFNVFWAGDSRRIAAVQLDTSQVWHEPLPHWLSNPPHTEGVAYPRAGEPMHEFRLVVIDGDSGKRVSIQTGDTQDHYVDLIGWTADDTAVLYQTLDRTHHHLKLFAADPDTGQSRLVLQEDTPTYFDAPMTRFENTFHLLKSSQQFLYLSERDGWRHIYLYGTDGELVRRLTSGQWPVYSVLAVDEEQGWVYFRASRDMQTPYDLHFFRVALTGGELQQLTVGPGLHKINLSPALDSFVDQYSSPEHAPVVEWRSTSGELIAEVSRTNITALESAGFLPPQPFVAPSTDGNWDSRGLIYRPFHFDPQQKYPVVEFIYAGMQVSHVPHDYYNFGPTSSSLVLRSLLHSGFVVVMIDSPGTPDRGRAYQDATYGIWPQTVIPNHVQWIREAAASRPWMDLNRVGIYGHSWGAYMAQRGMIEAPDLYRAAAAHAGGSDFYDQPTYIEPFMGLPEENPEGYAIASNLTRIDQIRGPVLVMPMPMDVNAGFSPGMKFLDAMVAARKDVELFIQPEQNHRMNCCGRDREMYTTATITRFFRRHLKTGE